ncbi:carbon-nitrogen hydrolase family protein [Sulfurospirillum sp. 1612]|uniref:carbon-nitrogen hydrolase family protein n=1 Tax=Sulfurospirillum sp. 1612 TaxID=3094835 RepID=UPI002F94FC0E
MTSNHQLVALQFQYATKSFEENFETLSRLVKNTQEGSIILAPELCLSGYDYEHLDANTKRAQHFLPQICELSKARLLALTIAEKQEGKYYNNVKIFFDGREIYSRPKARLFHLGDEEKYFTEGTDETIHIIEVAGIKIAILLCFELRFLELWERAKGADIIFVPAYWSKKRKYQLQTLANGLAIMNQCYVLVANSSDENMASNACIIDPFGDITKDDTQERIMTSFDRALIKKMRRYINIGLD